MGVLDNMYQLSVCDTPKKRAKRMIWTDEQERSFLRAVAKLGEDAIPSEIHNEMKHPEISRKQVSSHLQTYLKKRMRKLVLLRSGLLEVYPAINSITLNFFLIPAKCAPFTFLFLALGLLCITN